ncbi:hypothetical protein [Mycobacterium avium]|uniref:hypothetical protein n=1 Tax=Mycobacterium avium TaxID=1764 RepID=UPI00030D8D2A|nr:hypothetical protein [Mycobacterium avium]KDP08627.1 membrane protein [Mycobacterium avium subsp. hominissuis 101]MBZ4508134.1 hypothetical protein [Mycobacterium avium subsp. hominissuis]MBZ4547414.1 hypothetical protein [Mycobacterium avium subsp. hominissuis]MBZ4566739.1 hypothetical protein [Mycobacterium avium subsp. hominissuis]
MKGNPLYGPAFYAVIAALFLALFVVNVIHGTWLGLICTGGLAELMGYNAYRAWFAKRHQSRQ